MTDDCISRQAVLDSFWKLDIELRPCAIDAIVNMINNLPPVTPKEKTGRWINDEFGSKCSCCGRYTHLDKFDRPMKFMYCSMCGAKMVEPQESEG